MSSTTEQLPIPPAKQKVIPDPIPGMSQSQTVFLRTLEQLGPNRSRLDLDRIPGPAPHPLLGWIGNGLRFYRDPISYVHMLKSSGYGEVVSFSRGLKRGLVLPSDQCPGVIFAFGAENHRKTLINDDVFEGGVLSAPQGLGDASRLSVSLPWMAGYKHRQQRRLIFPSYHQKMVNDYRDVMVRVINRMLDRFQIGEPVAMMRESVHMFGEFECAMVLGIGDNPTGEWADLWERYYDFFLAFSTPWAHIPINLPFTTRRKVITQGKRIFSDFEKLVEMKQKGNADGIDLISVLVRGRYEDGTTLTQEELVAESAQLFVSGWATTRGPIAWITFLLAQHPDIAADLHDEVTSVLHGDAPTMEQLKQMPLLDAVVKEALRLLPPIHFVTRVPQQPVELGGYEIPAMTECYSSLYETHREPDVFPEPARFNPKRWETAKPGPYGYLPYGIGERSCIGIALANMQLRMFFAMLIQRYRMDVPRNNLKVNHSGILLLPTPDLKMIARKQDREFKKSQAPVRGNITRSVHLPV